MSIPTPSHGPGDDLVADLRTLVEDLPDGLWADGGLTADIWRDALVGPALDILSRSGKGFRGRLLEHSWTLAGGRPGELPRVLPLAIEILHTGSLVVDDIEDDSSTRRGEPALHRRFGLPLALNTGNWLYFLSTSLVSQADLAPEIRLALLEDLSLGLLRCHQGQALDLSVSITTVPRARVAEIVHATTRLKTGALMGLAMTVGARAADAPREVVDAIATFGTEVGVGLQMLDDWSGIKTDARREKGIEDLRLGRPTWPWAWLAAHDNQLALAEVVHKVRDSSIDWEFDQARKLMVSHLGSVPPRLIANHFARAASALADELGGRGHVEPVETELRALLEAYG